MRINPNLKLIFFIIFLYLFNLSCVDYRGVASQRKRSNRVSRDTISIILDTIVELKYIEHKYIISDKDGDGINDQDDRCPDISGSVDSYGCPKASNNRMPASVEFPVDSGAAYVIQSVPVRPSRVRHQPVKTGGDDNGNKLPDASIAYGYRNKLKVGNTMDIRVRIELNRSKTEVEATLKKIMNEKKPVRIAETDSSITNSISIDGDKRFRIKPEYDHSIFFIEPSSTETKELNLTGPTNWSWRVKALKATNESHINLKVYAVDDNDTLHERNEGVMYIMVTVDDPQSGLPKATFLSNYGWLLFTGVFIVLCAWFFLWKKRLLNVSKSSPIYFSYAWDQQETIIDQLYESLEKSGFDVIRDKTDLRYKGIISKFMIDIGKADFVVVAISDKYLRSQFCMFELFEIYRNAKMDCDEFSKRIFPLRLENINLNDPDVINTYINYWEQEKSKWDKRINENSDNITPEQTKQYQIVKWIVTDLTTLLRIIADINALDIEQLLKDDFAELKSVIRKQLE